jgi:membrane-bound lytic murein transglycosylase B
MQALLAPSAGGYLGRMDRRAFLLLTLAGAADPGAGPLSLADPAPAAPDVATPIAGSGDAAFDAWAADFLARSLRAGGPVAVLRREFAGLTPDPRIVALDGRQPEFSKPIGDYVKGVVTEARITSARNHRAAVSQLPAIARHYGVPADILVSIWAVESGFGAVMGDFDVLRSLATLAAEGRRRAWAEAQITAVIKIIATGEASRAQLRGSWAGAMGQTQFEPETFLTTAVDGDGDGRRDIWTSTADALASAANLMARAGWRSGEAWQAEVALPSGFDYGLAEGEHRTPAAWAALGARRADGAHWPEADADAAAQLLLPAGAGGPAFLAFPNHFVIRKYNNSVAYALAVGLLADRIGGARPLARAWPAEIPLSLADRIAAQKALSKLGYDTGAADGVVGANTRSAMRAWQKARGLPADGYLSVDLVGRLVNEAAVSAPLAPVVPIKPAIPG